MPIPDQWNPPRVAVVLCHRGKVRLARSHHNTSWRFPEGVPQLKDRTPAKTAERIMMEQFKLPIVVRDIIEVAIRDMGDHMGQIVVYVRAVPQSEDVTPLPGFQMEALNVKRLEHEDAHVSYEVPGLVRKALEAEQQEDAA